MSPLERSMLEKHRANLEVAKRFQCAACSIVKTLREGDDVYVWKPESGMMKRLAKNNVATFVLCSECSRKPDKETRPQIEASLSKRGLFG